MLLLAQIAYCESRPHLLVQVSHLLLAFLQLAAGLCELRLHCGGCRLGCARPVLSGGARGGCLCQLLLQLAHTIFLLAGTRALRRRGREVCRCASAVTAAAVAARVCISAKLLDLSRQPLLQQGNFILRISG